MSALDAASKPASVGQCVFWLQQAQCSAISDKTLSSKQFNLFGPPAGSSLLRGWFSRGRAPTMSRGSYDLLAQRLRAFTAFFADAAWPLQQPGAVGGLPEAWFLGP